MKAPAFWQKPETFLSRIISPIGQLYQATGNLRRLVTKPYVPKVPAICLGNITVGGSGKTPAAIAIADIIKQEGGNPVFVSRGYLGQERGPLRVDPTKHGFKDVGDEALLLARHAPCWIGKNRAAAVQAAEAEATHIILDDGLQNTSIKAQVYLLVVDGAAGFGNGRLIPAGPLRETLANALPRLHGCIMVGERNEEIAKAFSLSSNIRRLNLDLPDGFALKDKLIATAPVQKPVFMARIEADAPTSQALGEEYLAFAGIGRPEKFYETCRVIGLKVMGTRDFPDHHVYTIEDLKYLRSLAAVGKSRLLTTEKDFVRLPPEFQSEVGILPVTLKFAAREELRNFLQSATVA